MKFLSGCILGFASCFILAVFAVWAYDRHQNESVVSDAWFAHDDQTYKINADIELLNQRIYAECTAIEDRAREIKAPAIAEIRQRLFSDSQQARHACWMFAYITFDVALTRKLPGYRRQEMGYNLISAGFNADGLINDVNSNNDGLIQIADDVAPGSKTLLISLRRDMDEAHALASRLKCEREPSKPIHVYAIPE